MRFINTIDCNTNIIKSSPIEKYRSKIAEHANITSWRAREIFYRLHQHTCMLRHLLD